MESIQRWQSFSHDSHIPLLEELVELPPAGKVSAGQTRLQAPSILRKYPVEHSEHMLEELHMLQPAGQLLQTELSG